jgi:hypothetical protein
MNIPNHGDHERAHWAAAKLQARFRGKKTRSFTNSKKLAVLRADSGFQMLVMSRIAEFASKTSANFIQQLEDESQGRKASAILHEANGNKKMRKDDIETTKLIINGYTMEEIEKHKELSESQQLDGFEMKDHTFAQDQIGSTISSNNRNLFVKEFPVYPKLVLSFQAHDDRDDNIGTIVQRCWVEVPDKSKPMRMLRVRQDQINDATAPVVRHSKIGTVRSKNADQMSEGGFSSASSLGDSDDLNSLYSEDEDVEDLELSTNLHDLL